MVPHLINAGHEVGVVDVGREAVESAVSHGASEASGPAELAATCEIVFTSLPTGAEVDEVYLGEGGLMEAVGEGGLLVDLSTIEPEQSRKLAAEAAERGAVAIDAPVSGGVMGAEAASLTIMVGGPKEAFDAAQPILALLGKNIIHVGGHGAGQVAKLCNNLIAGVTMVAAAEAFAMGKASGVDTKILHEVIRTSSGGSWVMEKDPPCPGLIEGAPSSKDFEAGFHGGFDAQGYVPGRFRSHVTGVAVSFRRGREPGLPHGFARRSGRIWISPRWPCCWARRSVPDDRRMARKTTDCAKRPDWRNGLMEEMNPAQMSALRAAEAIREGELTSEELVEACLARIEEQEEQIGAWEHLDKEFALMQAREADLARGEGKALGPFHGVPVGIKDVIDTADSADRERLPSS